jgi:tape measure domain-containing protein
MVGSVEQGNKLLQQVKDYANYSPYVFSDVSEAGKLLLNYGVQAHKILPTLKMLGDVAGGDANKLQSLSLAYSQVQATGRLMGQDLLQLVNAGFNPLKIISEKTGISMGVLKKKMEEGAISAKDIEKAFKIATSAGGLFFEMSDKQAETFGGKMSTLMDKLETGLTKVGEKLNTSIGPILDKILEVLDKGNLAAEGKQYNNVKKKQAELKSLYDAYMESKGTPFQAEYEQMILNSFPELGTDFTSGKSSRMSEEKLNNKLKTLQASRDAAYVPSYEFNRRIDMKYARIQALQDEINSGKDKMASNSPFSSFFGTDKLSDSDIRNKIKEIEDISNEIKTMQNDYASNFSNKKSRSDALKMLMNPYNTGGGFNLTGGKSKKTKEGDELGVRSGGARNVYINITKLVENLTFEKYDDQSEAKLQERITRTLIAAVNDVNIISQ